MVLDYHLPLVIDRAEGARIQDVDGNELIDMNDLGYGPLLFGHRPRLVTEAIERELQHRGTLLGFADTVSIEVAELVKQRFPSVDLLRFTSTGTGSLADRGQAGARVHRPAQADPVRGPLSRLHRRDVPSLPRLARGPGRLAWPRGNPGTEGMNGGPRDVLIIPFNDIARLEEMLARLIAARLRR